jgi:hypothetical protein
VTQPRARPSRNAEEVLDKVVEQATIIPGEMVE